MRKCVECSPNDIDNTNLLPWDTEAQGFDNPGYDSFFYFEVPPGGGYGTSSYVFNVYPGDGLPYAQIDFDDDGWPTGSFNITDADGNVVNPGDWFQPDSNGTPLSLNVDSTNMPSGMYGGNFSLNRAALPDEDPPEDEDPANPEVQVLVAAYQVEIVLHEDREQRGSPFALSIRRRITNRVRTGGSYPTSIFDLNWEPPADLTLNLVVPGLDSLTITNIPKESIVNGHVTLTNEITGATGNVTHTVRVNDPSTSGSTGEGTDTIEILGEELYVVSPAEPIAMDRGIATNVTIGARDAVTKIQNLAYAPPTKVDLVANASPESISPASIAAGSFAAGVATVPIIYTGGEGTGLKEILSLLQDNDSLAYGTMEVDLDDEPVPASCPGGLPASYNVSFSGHINVGATYYENGVWVKALANVSPCYWRLNDVKDIWVTIRYELVLVPGVSWDLTVTMFNSGVICRVWKDSRLVGGTPVGPYGALPETYSYLFAPCATSSGAITNATVL